MKKINKPNEKWLHTVLAVISIVLSVWAILVYEFKLHGIGLSWSYYEGWDTCAKNISYSILTGWLIYFLTSYVPFRIEKNKRQLVISQTLANLNWEISSIVDKYQISDRSTIQYFNIEVNGESVQIIPNLCILCIIKGLNWEYEFKPGITYKQQVITYCKKLYIVLTHLCDVNYKFLTKNQSVCINQIINMVMGNNWADLMSESNIDKDDLQQFLMSIIYPLQKSIGIQCGSKSLIVGNN